VQLAYDLAADRYSVVLNGVNGIMGESIPTYLDANSVERFGFGINQTDKIILPEVPAPKGNNFIVENVRFSHIEAMPEPATLLRFGSDLASYLLDRTTTTAERRGHRPRRIFLPLRQISPASPLAPILEHLNKVAESEPRLFPTSVVVHQAEANHLSRRKGHNYKPLPGGSLPPRWPL
jgi:hypothetical protein